MQFTFKNKFNSVETQTVKVYLNDLFAPFSENFLPAVLRKDVQMLKKDNEIMLTWSISPRNAEHALCLQEHLERFINIVGDDLGRPPLSDIETGKKFTATLLFTEDMVTQLCERAEVPVSGLDDTAKLKTGTTLLPPISGSELSALRKLFGSSIESDPHKLIPARYLGNLAQDFPEAFHRDTKTASVILPGAKYKFKHPDIAAIFRPAALRSKIADRIAGDIGIRPRLGSPEPEDMAFTQAMINRMEWYLALTGKLSQKQDIGFRHNVAGFGDVPFPAPSDPDCLRHQMRLLEQRFQIKEKLER